MKYIPLIVILIFKVTLLNCSKKEATNVQEQETKKITSNSYQLVVTALPEDCDVISAENMEFECAFANERATLKITFLPEEEGMNLVEISKKQKEYFENLGGEFKGTRELYGPFKTAFTARGRYQKNGKTIENLKIFTIHPTLKRVIKLEMEYVLDAENETNARVTQIINMLGELEVLPKQM